MAHIVKMALQRVVSAGSDPAMPARDSEIFLTSGDSLARVTMLDLFPHTGHLKSMVLFS